MKRMQPDDIPVGPDARMRRYEAEEEEDDACDSGDEKQEAVDDPPAGLPPPFRKRDKQDEKEKRPTADERREEIRRIRFRLIGKSFHQRPRGADELFCRTVRTGDRRCGERLFQIRRKEHHLVRGRKPVGRIAEREVASEREPRLVARAVVDQVAEGPLLERHAVVDLSARFPFDDGGRTCRAVVEEEVVAIYAVLRLVVDHQRLPDPGLAYGVEVQGLLRHFASPHLIFDHEVARVLRCQPIVCLSFGKTVDEVRFREVEYAIVEHYVELLRFVLYAQRRMSVDRVHLIFRRGDGQQADLGVFAEFRILCPDPGCGGE